MAIVVVDTNVAIVANGRNTHADQWCQLACVERLEHIVKHEIVAVDQKGLITTEYSNHLSWSGAPGVGDIFFKHLYDQQYKNSRVRQFPITESIDDRKGFDELPENKLDPSDQKFLAVAVVAKARVINATDSDWQENALLMQKLGVKVEQLCRQYAKK